MVQKSKWEKDIEKENLKTRLKDNPHAEISAARLLELFEIEWKNTSWILKLFISKTSAEIWYLNGARNGMTQLVLLAHNVDEKKK